MLLRCCLMHIGFIMLRHFLDLLFLCQYLSLGLFLPYVCALFFIFIFIFIMVNRIISWIQAHCFFACFLEYALLFLDNKVHQEFEQFSSNSKSPASECCLAFAWFLANFSLALVTKVLLIKKCVVSYGYGIVTICEIVHFFCSICSFSRQRFIFQIFIFKFV